MPAYARKTTIKDQFGARRTPDGAILCNRCNCNIADENANPEGTVYLLYTDKAHLNNNIPHDVYCEGCLNTYNPKPKIVQETPPNKVVVFESNKGIVMNSETYLFRAKIISKWESEGIYGPPIITTPSVLPLKIGSFILESNPNTQAYLEQELEGTNEYKTNPDYPLSQIYLELHLTVNKNGDARFLAEEHFQEVEALFRLFKQGGMYIRLHWPTWKVVDHKLHNIISFDFTPKLSNLNMHYLKSYKIDDEMLEEFKIFFEQYWNSVHSKKQPMYSSLLRLSSSYERLTLDERMVDLIIALEALFNDGGDNLAFKVALRCSSLIFPPGSDRKRCYDDIRLFYGNRSKILHGSKPTTRYSEDAINNLENIVRVSILEFYKLDNNGFPINSKDDLDSKLFLLDH